MPLPPGYKQAAVGWAVNTSAERAGPEVAHDCEAADDWPGCLVLDAGARATCDCGADVPSVVVTVAQMMDKKGRLRLTGPVE